MSDDKPAITWSPQKIKKLKREYKAAVDAKKDVFTFEDHAFVVGYAKYLIEYVEDCFSRAK